MLDMSNARFRYLVTKAGLDMWLVFFGKGMRLLTMWLVMEVSP
jgi:hypothetical protein